MMNSSAVPTQGTSFRKKNNVGSRIPGTKVSYHNVQLLTSSGVPSLDCRIGGGIGVGTVCLIEEDNYNTYSRILVKYFVAEGIINNHSIVLASGHDDPNTTLKEIPDVVETKNRLQATRDIDDLKIAWRYKEQKSLETSNEYSHNFDLSKKMTEERIKNANISTWTPYESLITECENSFLSASYTSLLQKISSVIEKEKLQSTEKHCNKILRIAISSLGTPLWTTAEKSASKDHDLIRFLYVLRSLLRSSFAVALVTIPAALLQNLKLRDKIQLASDYVVQLEAFVGSKKMKNSLIKEFDGLINVVKLPVINSFTYQVPVSDLAFKLQRKSFNIEQLHLPPDIEDASDAQSLLCGGGPSKLDF